MQTKLNECDAYAIAKELTKIALEQHLIQNDCDPTKAAKNVVAFFNEIFYSLQNPTKD